MRLTFLLLLLPVGCATTATIVTRDGRRTEAFVVEGDKDHLQLRNEFGVESLVRRDELRDIDYPGNVHATLGGVLAGLMGIELGVFGALCGTGGFSSTTCSIQLGAFGVIGAGGLAMLSWGLWTWLNAKSMVNDSLTHPPLPTAPVPEAPIAPPTLVPPPSL